MVSSGRARGVRESVLLRCDWTEVQHERVLGIVLSLLAAKGAHVLIAGGACREKSDEREE